MIASSGSRGEGRKFVAQRCSEEGRPQNMKLPSGLGTGDIKEKQERKGKSCVNREKGKRIKGPLGVEDRTDGLFRNVGTNYQYTHREMSKLRRDDWGEV